MPIEESQDKKTLTQIKVPLKGGFWDNEKVTININNSGKFFHENNARLRVKGNDRCDSSTQVLGSENVLSTATQNFNDKDETIHKYTLMDANEDNPEKAYFEHEDETP